MDGWVTLFGVCLVLWIGLKHQLHKLTAEWEAVMADAEEEWQHEDQWLKPDTAVNEARDRMLLLIQLQKQRAQSYEEVVLPLQPYVWTFLAFSIPAIVMAIDYCGTQNARVNERQSGPELGCFAGCYMVLSLRPLATATVYFLDQQCRAELLGYTAVYARSSASSGCGSPTFSRGISGWRIGATACGSTERSRRRESNREPGAEDDGAGSGVPFELMDSET